MPETKSATKPEIKKAVIITDPKNGVLTIAIPMDFEGSETTEAGPMDALVDFLQTFCLAPEKKPEAGFWSKDQNPCPFQCQCRSEEESAEIKAEPETTSSETEPLKLTPVQEFRQQFFEQLMDRYTGLGPDRLSDAAIKLVDWILNSATDGNSMAPVASLSDSIQSGLNLEQDLRLKCFSKLLNTRPEASVERLISDTDKIIPWVLDQTP